MHPMRRKDWQSLLTHANFPFHTVTGWIVGSFRRLNQRTMVVFTFYSISHCVISIHLDIVIFPSEGALSRPRSASLVPTDRESCLITTLLILWKTCNYLVHAEISYPMFRNANTPGKTSFFQSSCPTNKNIFLSSKSLLFWIRYRLYLIVGSVYWLDENFIVSKVHEYSSLIQPHCTFLVAD